MCQHTSKDELAGRVFLTSTIDTLILWFSSACYSCSCTVVCERARPHAVETSLWSLRHWWGLQRSLSLTAQPSGCGILRQGIQPPVPGEPCERTAIFQLSYYMHCWISQANGQYPFSRWRAAHLPLQLLESKRRYNDPVTNSQIWSKFCSVYTCLRRNHGILELA